MSMLRHPIAWPIPVPKAFDTASLPAKRAARWRSGNFIDIEYSISPSVKTRCRNRSPNRSTECRMREHSITSTPIPITLMRKCHRVQDNAIHLWLSLRIICHSGEHFLHGILQTDPHGTRYDRVADIELVQTWNVVDEGDVLVVDAMASV